jgi:hypothetical protein
MSEVTLTAEQARALSPRDSAGAILDHVERAIRNAAIAGKTSIEISGIMPGWEAWVVGKPDRVLADVAQALKTAGYEIESYTGGHSGRGYVRVAWDEQ